MGGFILFRKFYTQLLKWALENKLLFLSIPAVIIILGVSVWKNTGKGTNDDREKRLWGTVVICDAQKTQPKKRSHEMTRIDSEIRLRAVVVRGESGEFWARRFER